MSRQICPIAGTFAILFYGAPALPRAPPLGKISPGRGKMAKPKRGTAGASAPERASPTEEKEKHSDTRTLTNRVRIAVSSRWSCSSYNLSVSHSLDSSLNEGASGEKEKLLALPKPPSQREVASRSDDGRSIFLHIRTLFYPKTLHNASVFVIFSG